MTNTRFPSLASTQLLTTLQHSVHSVTIKLIGELDMAVADDVSDTIWELVVERDALRSIRLDVTNVTFVDSAGLHVLSQAHRTAVEWGLTFTLVAPPDCAVARLVRLCASQHWFSAPTPDLLALAEPLRLTA